MDVPIPCNLTRTAKQYTWLWRYGWCEQQKIRFISPNQPHKFPRHEEVGIEKCRLGHKHPYRLQVKISGHLSDVLHEVHLETLNGWLVCRNETPIRSGRESNGNDSQAIGQ